MLRVLRIQTSPFAYRDVSLVIPKTYSSRPSSNWFYGQGLLPFLGICFLDEQNNPG